MAITFYNNKAMGNPIRKMVVAGRRYWLTRDGKLVVDGDARAYSLYAHPHHRVPEDELKALLAASDIPSGSKSEPEVVAAPEPPQVAKKRASRKKSSSKRAARKAVPDTEPEPVASDPE